MKEIGNPYTIRGSYTPDGGFNFDNPLRIQLFDGRFDTGYRITKFYVWGKGIEVGNDNDVLGLLATEDLETPTSGIVFDAGVNSQIGWASNRGTTYGDANAFQKGIIDPDNMVIEDLFFYGFAGDQGSSLVNYLIEMQKYDIAEWEGALNMVRNRSQG